MSNGLVSTMSTGTTYGTLMTVKSKYLRPDSTAPVAVYHHPHAGTAWGIMNPDTGTYPNNGTNPGQRGVVEMLATAGYVVSVGDFNDGSGGNTAQWANDANQTGITAAINAAKSFGGSSSKKALLVGSSMGACSVMSYAGRYPANVAAVIGIIPALDINVYKTPGVYGPNDSGSPYSFAYTIDPAYGGTYTGGDANHQGGTSAGGYIEATNGAQHNPQTMAAANAYATMPIQLWHGDADTLAPFQLVSLFYQQVYNLAPSAPITINAIPGTGNQHNDATIDLVPDNQLLGFARRYLPV